MAGEVSGARAGGPPQQKSQPAPKPTPKPDSRARDQATPNSAEPRSRTLSTPEPARHVREGAKAILRAGSPTTDQMKQHQGTGQYRFAGLNPYRDDVMGLRTDDRTMYGIYPPGKTGDQFEKAVASPGSIELRQIFAHWDSPRKGVRALKKELESVYDRGDRPVIHLGTDQAGKTRASEAISPGALARGEGDAYLTAVSQLLNSGKLVKNASDQHVWVRPYAEMNGSFNPYSSHNPDGSARDKDHAASQYQKAFQRTSIILHGGSVDDMNDQLEDAGLPLLRTDKDIEASNKVAVIWNPHGRSDPDVPGNQPEDYYPGDKYLDATAVDHYDNGYESTVTDIYNQFAKDKPFILGEFGVQTDNPKATDAMFSWIRKHNIAAAMWYDGLGDRFSTTDGSKPATVDSLKRNLATEGR